MFTPEERRALIDKLRQAPAQLEAAVAGLTDAQIDYIPQEGEWSIRQVVHHMPDSHMQGFIRMKWMLTEDQPTIKLYNQPGFAALPDTSTTPISVSLDLLELLHLRWADLLDNLTEADWARTANHPERGIITVADMLKTYVDHGENHVSQINNALAAYGANS